MEPFLIEIQGIYGGWSVRVTKHGSMHNRWSREAEPRRWKATEDWLDNNYPERCYHLSAEQSKRVFNSPVDKFIDWPLTAAFLKELDGLRDSEGSSEP